MTKSFLQSKTIWGGIILVANLIGNIFGAGEIISPELASNIGDGGLNTQDWLNLSSALIGGALVVIGRKQAKRDITIP